VYERFAEAFEQDSLPAADPGREPLQSRLSEFDALIHRFGGRSFRQGLYRVVPRPELTAWTAVVTSAFPAYQGQVGVFAFDWLGRAFGCVTDRLENERPGVAMFEPGTGQVLEIPCNVVDFHESELIDFADAALADAFHRLWLADGGSVPERHQCIGYRKPLFLGGSDDVSNLELCDLDVYWGLAAQLTARLGDIGREA